MLYERYKYSEYNLRTCLWNVSHFSTSIPCALITPTSRGQTFSGVRGIYHFPNRCLLNNSSWNPVQLWDSLGNICVCPMCARNLVPNLTPNCVEPLWSHNKITRFDLTIDNKIPAPSTKLTCLILLDFLLFVWSDFSFILSPLALCVFYVHQVKYHHCLCSWKEQLSKLYLSYFTIFYEKPRKPRLCSCLINSALLLDLTGDDRSVTDDNFIHDIARWALERAGSRESHNQSQ